MPVPVTIVEWQPGMPIPLHELDGQMFEVPAVGDSYWRGGVATRVREVDRNADPVRVHLERDIAHEQAMLAGLPADCFVDCARDSNTGRWHAEVTRNTAVIASGFGDDGDALVQRVVADAAARLP